MEYIYHWLQNNLDIVFFVYGLAFFMMGLTILVQPREGSAFKVADVLWLLAAFGLAHGVNEWLDMWAIIKGRNELLDSVRWFCLVISFFFLFEFGRRLFVTGRKKLVRYLGWWLSPVLGLSILVFSLYCMLSGSDFWETGSILARYIFGFSGALLTGLGFFSYYDHEREILRPLEIKRYFLWAGISFLAYGVLSGLVVPKGNFFPSNCLNTDSFFSLVHIPVQVFRAGLAGSAGLAVCGMLSIFNWETRKKLLDALEREKESKSILLKTNELFEKVFSSAHLIIAYMDRDFNFIRVNRAYAEVDEHSPEFFVGKNHFDLYPDIENEAVFRRVVETGEPYFVYEKPFEYPEHPERGMTYWDWSLQPVKGADGKVGGLILSLIDVTDRKRAEDERSQLEEQLRQLQKMETIGQLAGSIAHDFNNIITAVTGYGSLLRMNMGKDDPLMTYAEQILIASEKASNLTRQLLAFSRKQIIDPRPVNLNEIISRLGKLLQRLIGEDIELKTILADKGLIIMADSGQIEQVLMNLATNARDAMSKGGFLTIETGLVDLDMEYFKTHAIGKPGMYACIAVTDTGMGMDEKTKERIFEPFFTTREMGRGTGLGLAIVYGIIRQHNGYINVYSEPDKGTTLRIYLPLIGSELKELASEALPAPKGGTETVLVAEDDIEVRRLTKEVLEGSGYKVTEAEDGVDAINKFMEDKNGIQILLFDLIMPKKNGKEAYEEIRKMRPDIKVLFTSGYTADIIHAKGILEEGINLISKPVSPDDLLRKLREVLDRGTS